jgi:hypothetical protein
MYPGPLASTAYPPTYILSTCIQALLRLYQEGSIQALSRLYQGSINAL